MIPFYLRVDSRLVVAWNIAGAIDAKKQAPVGDIIFGVDGKPVEGIAELAPRSSRSNPAPPHCSHGAPR